MLWPFETQVLAVAPFTSDLKDLKAQQGVAS